MKLQYPQNPPVRVITRLVTSSAKPQVSVYGNELIQRKKRKPPRDQNDEVIMVLIIGPFHQAEQRKSNCEEETANAIEATTGDGNG